MNKIDKQIQDINREIERIANIISFDEEYLRERAKEIERLEDKKQNILKNL